MKLNTRKLIIALIGAVSLGSGFIYYTHGSDSSTASTVLEEPKILMGQLEYLANNLPEDEIRTRSIIGSIRDSFFGLGIQVYKFDETSDQKQKDEIRESIIKSINTINELGEPIYKSGSNPDIREALQGFNRSLIPVLGYVMKGSK